jgi:hypothetical protein
MEGGVCYEDTPIEHPTASIGNDTNEIPALPVGPRKRFNRREPAREPARSRPNDAGNGSRKPTAQSKRTPSKPVVV